MTSHFMVSQDEILWMLTQAGVLSKEESVEFQSTITKVDKDKQMVFGWVTVATEDGKEVTDRQGDRITPDEMEAMAYRFVLTSREAGEMHEKIGVGKLIESIVMTKEKQEALGIDLGFEGWWCGFKITDKDVWEKVKDGSYSAFSIHGKGIRSKIAD